MFRAGTKFQSTIRRTLMPFLAAKDATQLYWRDRGEGRPMLFLDSLGCGSGAVMAVQISPPATMITILSPTMSPR
jgi:hypothetical protein